MHLYTIVLDYAGGTYVAQVHAGSQNAAFSNWLREHRSQEAAGSSPPIADAFNDDTAELVALEGLTSVWCASAATDNGLALVNVIRTDAASVV